MHVTLNPPVASDTQAPSQSQSPSGSNQSANDAGANLPPSGVGLPVQAAGKHQNGHQFEAAFKRLKQAIKQTAPALKLTVELQSGYMVAKLIDRQSKKVILQLPPEQVIQLARHPERLAGSLLRASA